MGINIMVKLTLNSFLFYILQPIKAMAGDIIMYLIALSKNTKHTIVTWNIGHVDVIMAMQK
jgi:hypothetical protein